MDDVRCIYCGQPLVGWSGGRDQPLICGTCRSHDPRFSPRIGAAPRTEREKQTHGTLTRLRPLNYYLICDHHGIVARWKNDSKGWMFRIRDGFVRVAHVADDLPWFGDFILIEIGVQRRRGTRLTHVAGFQLREAFALCELVKSDTAVLNTVVNPAELTPRQKECVKEFVQSKYLRPVWENIEELM